MSERVGLIGGDGELRFADLVTIEALAIQNLKQGTAVFITRDDLLRAAQDGDSPVFALHRDVLANEAVQMELSADDPVLVDFVRRNGGYAPAASPMPGVSAGTHANTTSPTAGASSCGRRGRRWRGWIG